MNFLATLLDTVSRAWDSLTFRVLVCGSVLAALPAAFLAHVAGSLN